MKQHFSRHAFLTAWLAGIFLLCFSTSSVLAADTEKAAEPAPERAEDTPQKPEEARPAVQPQLQTGSDATPEIDLPDAVNTDI
jgi:hemolysin activation/secretion protein